MPQHYELATGLLLPAKPGDAVTDEATRDNTLDKAAGWPQCCHSRKGRRTAATVRLKIVSNGGEKLVNSGSQNLRE